MNSADYLLQASYNFCRRLSRRSGSNFYLGFLLLPREKRRAMDAIYAFMRYSDDLVDAAPTSAFKKYVDVVNDQRRDQLQRWRRALENAFAGRDVSVVDPRRLSDGSFPNAATTAMSLLPALVNTVQKYRVPVECLYAVLDGVEMDLQRRRYETFAELRLYCQRVASAVGLACIHIWGFHGQGTTAGDAAIESARQAGIALQLTNILRDLKADAAADRIYLPLDDIRSCGYSVEELKNGLVNEAFYRLMSMEINRAKQFYREGIKLMDYLQRDGQRIFGLMMSTYWRLLNKISDRPPRIFPRPVQLGINHRLLLAASWALMPSTMMRLIKEQMQIKA